MKHLKEGGKPRTIADKVGDGLKEKIIK